MIIGGGQLYAEALPLADRMVVTLVDCEPEADTWFPVWDQREWAEVECTILSSRIDQRKIGVDVKTEYSLGVMYGYTYEGKSYTSDRFSLRGAPWSSSEEKAKTRQEEYPEGEKMTCHVDPAEPTFAVLKLDSKGPGYSLWFPLLFQGDSWLALIQPLWIKKRSTTGPKIWQSSPGALLWMAT